MPEDQAKKIAIKFAAEFVYYKANPETKKDVPPVVYENVKMAYEEWITEHEKNPTKPYNPFQR